MKFSLRGFFIGAIFGVITFPVKSQNANLQLRSSIEYPGQTLANVCGWTSPAGREYALIGAQKGLIITDITNPDVPVQIVQIPGPNNLWKEIKTFSHYAYVTSENGNGVQIVDLSALPSGALQYHNYVGNGNIPESMTSIHTLHIDVKKGFLYTYGGNLNSAAVHDLNADPYNPNYVGRFDALGYIHDGYADNDTLYACHIGAGLLSIVDMSDKSNPVILGAIQTPGKFTHNSWLLDDHKHILTTDETTPSFVTCYDISDPSDIIELDRFSIDDGQGSITHNVQVINDYAVVAWYAGGVVIIDCHRPQNLVQVGRYDTYPSSSELGIKGCWGAFPNFPSGTIIASNVDPDPTAGGQLFVFTPTYQRASYIEGVVKNGCDGTFLKGATLKILGGDFGSSKVSSHSGEIRTGQLTPGEFTVKISKPFYVTKTFQVNLIPGEVSEFDITLDPVSDFDVSGQVLNELGQPVPYMPITLYNSNQIHNLVTNANGEYNFNCVFPGSYFVVSEKWGLAYKGEISVNSDINFDIVLKKQYYDDFSSDYGWEQTSTALTGLWTRGEPIGTFVNHQCNPEDDVQTDVGDQCFMTGNGGISCGSDDVDGGNVILTSPAMALSEYTNPILTFNYWFYNGSATYMPNDHFEVHVSNGIEEVTLFSTNMSGSIWNASPEIYLANFIAINDNIKVSFHTADDTLEHLVEAALDVFSVKSDPVNTLETYNDIEFKVSPNPSVSDFFLQYSSTDLNNTILEVRNILGQVMLSKRLDTGESICKFGDNWPSGVYTVYITNGHQKSMTKNIVKSD